MPSNKYALKDSKGNMICAQTRIANNPFSRMKGLMFSQDLSGDDGLLIRPCNSIHTFFMRYSLDVIFLDKNFKVIKVIYDLKPWKMSWIYFKANQVLEMKDGTMRKDILEGEMLEAICIN